MEGVLERGNPASRDMDHDDCLAAFFVVNLLIKPMFKRATAHQYLCNMSIISEQRYKAASVATSPSTILHPFEAGLRSEIGISDYCPMNLIVHGSQKRWQHIVSHERNQICPVKTNSPDYVTSRSSVIWTRNFQKPGSTLA